MGGPPRAARFHFRQHNGGEQRHPTAIPRPTAADRKLPESRAGRERPRGPLRRPHSGVGAVHHLPRTHLQRQPHRPRIPAAAAGHLSPRGRRRRHQSVPAGPHAGLDRHQVFREHNRGKRGPSLRSRALKQLANKISSLCF